MMISPDSKILEAFLFETENFLIGARVQKIQQPTRREIILHLRNNFDSRKLYININPQFAHLCFMGKGHERGLVMPQHPPMFCMLLRKHMEGAKIVKAQKPENERIIELIFENYNEIGDRIEECLSIELMGKHSNIVLYNTDTNIILGCAHNVGSEKSKERELAGGLPYIYPPKQDKKNLLKTRFTTFEKIIANSGVELKKIINEKFLAIPQITVEEFCGKMNIKEPASQEDLQKLYIALHEYLEDPCPYYSMAEDFSIYSSVMDFPIKYSSVNELLDDYYGFHTEQTNIRALSSLLRISVNKEIKRLKNNLRNQSEQVEKANKSLMQKHKGDLIMANLYSLKNFGSTVVLNDYITGEDISIEMDVQKSAVENANRYYKMYNKAKRAASVAEEMMTDTKNELDYYLEILYSIENASSFQELFEIKQEISPDKYELKNKSSDKKTNVMKIEINGYNVYIGKNNKQNDYIYSKISSPDDLWFHVLNSPGSHILIKTEKNTPDNDTLLKAAQLAKQYSTAKNSSKTSVIYTLRKYIKRPLNTKSGFVVFKNESEIVVE